MIIGLIGFKQVGKSTAAKHLESRGYTRINMKDALVAELKQNFPDLLKELVRVYGMSIDELFANKPAAMRALMQNYGTEVRRRDKDSYWTDKWTEAASYEGDGIVVDDVRFLNEAQAVRSRGGILIRLTRPDITSGGTHASETEQLQIVADHTIECEPGGHERLYEELDKILNGK